MKDLNTTIASALMRLETSAGWFEDLSIEEKKAYIKKHPKSWYAHHGDMSAPKKKPTKPTAKKAAPAAKPGTPAHHSDATKEETTKFAKLSGDAFTHRLSPKDVKQLEVKKVKRGGKDVLFVRNRYGSELPGFQSAVTDEWAKKSGFKNTQEVHDFLEKFGARKWKRES